MKKDSKVRLFEVMSRLDKTFKSKLNEGFEEIKTTDAEVPAQTGDEFPEKEELSVEEKYVELKNKVEELYAMIHGEESEVEPEAEMNERKKWNFEKKKGEKESDDDEDESKELGKSETPAEEKAEHKAKKIPVAAIAKVGK